MRSLFKFCLFLLLFPLQSNAQGFISAYLEEYYTACVDARNCIKDKRCDELLLCADRISKMPITDLSESDFISLQPEQEIGLDGHVVFNDAGLIIVAEAIINGNSTNYNLHSTYRGNDIYLAHRVIPANSTMRYQLTCLDNVEMLVFLETMGRLDVTILDENGNCAEDLVTCSGYGWNILSFHAGDMPAAFVIEATNKEDIDICCAFAINGQ